MQVAHASLVALLTGDRAHQALPTRSCEVLLAHFTVILTDLVPPAVSRPCSSRGFAEDLEE